MTFRSLRRSSQMNASMSIKVAFIVVTLLQVLPAASQKTWAKLNNCTNSTQMENPLIHACSFIRQLDLVIVVDESIYQDTLSNSENDRKDYVENYESFLQYFMRWTNFSYGPDGVRRMIIKTDWQNGFIVLQNYSHGNFKSDPDDELLKPYQKNATFKTYQRSDPSYRRDETGLGKVFRYISEIQKDRIENEKVVLVLTRGTRTKKDFLDVLSGLSTLAKDHENKFYVYIIHFWTWTETIFRGPNYENFLHKLDEEPDLSESKLSLRTIRLYYNKVKQLDVKRVAHCVCEFLKDCQSELKQTPCHYVMSDEDELCRRNKSLEILRNHSSCPTPFNNRTELCSNHSECDKDCDKKGWTDWTPCWKNGTRFRKRKNIRASFSQNTLSCPFSMVEPCDPLNRSRPAEPCDLSNGNGPAAQNSNQPAEHTLVRLEVVIAIVVVAVVIIVALVVVVIVVMKRSTGRGKMKSKSGSMSQISAAKESKASANKGDTSQHTYIQTLPTKDGSATKKQSKSYSLSAAGKSQPKVPKADASTTGSKSQVYLQI